MTKNEKQIRIQIASVERRIEEAQAAMGRAHFNNVALREGLSHKINQMLRQRKELKRLLTEPDRLERMQRPHLWAHAVETLFGREGRLLCELEVAAEKARRDAEGGAQ